VTAVKGGCKASRTRTPLAEAAGRIARKRRDRANGLAAFLFVIL
jgi:hypothetical protein